MDIVFVHGIDGNWESTWRPRTHPDGDPLWPVALGRVLDREGISCRVFTLNYPGRTRGDSAPIRALAEFALAPMVREVTAPRILFVCHSLGGILVKQLLFQAQHHTNTKGLQNRTAGILFLGTPHNGAKAARLMKRARLASRTLEELQPDSSFLTNLSEFFKKSAANCDWAVRQFAEGRDTGWGCFKTRVVTESSAFSGVGRPCYPAMEDDHITLPKVNAAHEVFKQSLEMARDLVRGPTVDPAAVKQALRLVVSKPRNDHE